MSWRNDAGETIETEELLLLPSGGSTTIPNNQAPPSMWVPPAPVSACLSLSLLLSLSVYLCLSLSVSLCLFLPPSFPLFISIPLPASLSLSSPPSLSSSLPPSLSLSLSLFLSHSVSFSLFLSLPLSLSFLKVITERYCHGLSVVFSEVTVTSLHRHTVLRVTRAVWRVSGENSWLTTWIR